METMDNLDTITGEKILIMMERLQRDGTILKMEILKMEYKGFTIITDIQKRHSSFLIDYPGGPKEVIIGSTGRRVSIEFSGEDGMQYSFRSTIVGFEDENIVMSFPEAIERIQRRKFFRVAVPPGTLIILNTYNKRYDFNVLNLSEGGALINQKARFHDKGLLFVGGQLKNLYIVNYEDNRNTRIGVKEAEIIRVEKNSETNRYLYALQFINLGNKEKEDIRAFIYRCQRNALKRRSFA